MKKLFVLAFLTASATAHAAPIALEGSYHFLAKMYGRGQSDENKGCPANVIVKADYDSAGNPTQLKLWNPGEFAENGYVAVTIENLGQSSERGPGLISYGSVEKIGDTYAEATDSVRILGFSKTTESMWVKLQRSPESDELSYQAFDFGPCFYNRD